MRALEVRTSQIHLCLSARGPQARLVDLLEIDVESALRARDERRRLERLLNDERIAERGHLR